MPAFKIVEFGPGCRIAGDHVGVTGHIGITVEDLSKVLLPEGVAKLHLCRSRDWKGDTSFRIQEGGWDAVVEQPQLGRLSAYLDAQQGAEIEVAMSKLPEAIDREDGAPFVRMINQWMS